MNTRKDGGLPSGPWPQLNVISTKGGSIFPLCLTTCCFSSLLGSEARLAQACTVGVSARAALALHSSAVFLRPLRAGQCCLCFFKVVLRNVSLMLQKGFSLVGHAIPGDDYRIYKRNQHVGPDSNMRQHNQL